LFQRLTSKKTITGEDEEVESELKYLEVIRDIRDNNLELFSKVKHLPKKARSSRNKVLQLNSLLTYFRKGKLHKFFISNKNEVKELDFLESAKLLETIKDTPRCKIDKTFYELLEKNKQAFLESTTEFVAETAARGGRDNVSKILRSLRSKQFKNYLGFTENDDEYIQRIIKLLEDGALPKQTTKTVAKDINGLVDPVKILAKIKTNIPDEFLTEHKSQSAANTFGPREVILSEYLIK